MVHIEKVEISGFKSFGFKNTVVKLVPGLVSISGPNGSGKSTILDAIAFALGEMSYKTLRGDSLKSLVHGATNNGSNTGHARVGVHLDNKDRSIPLDSDHVEITRVMEGSGESTYYLNKQKITRNRVISILDVANAVLGQLNNVQQGTVTRIAEFSSEERRRAIEDLIGLSYFDEKREGAEQALKDADGRLEVALAQMGNVQTRILEMEEERNHILRHDILRHDIDRYNMIQTMRNLADLRRQEDELTSKIADIDEDVAKTTASLAEVDAKIESAEADKTSIQIETDAYGVESTRISDMITAASDAVQNAQSAHKRAEWDLTHHKTNLAELRNTISSVIKSRVDNRIRSAELSTMSDVARQRADQTATDLAYVNEQLRDVLERQSKAAEQRVVAERTLRLFHNTKSQHMSSLIETRVWIENHATKIESNRQRLGMLEVGLSELNTAKKRLDKWVRLHNSLVDDLGDVIKTLEDERTMLSSEMAEISEIIRLTEQAATKYDSKLHLVRKVMHEDYSVASLQSDAPGLGVLGLAYKLLSWPPEMERAVMAAGSDWLKALVVEDVEAAVAISDVVMSKGLPRLRIIPLLSMAVSQPPAGRLSEHISCEARFEPLREFIFGGTVLAESEDSARRHADAGLRAVTIDGLCVEPAKAATLDRGSRISNLAKIISMSAEISGLQRLVAELEHMRNKHSSRLAHIDTEVQQASTRLSELRTQLAAAAEFLSNTKSKHDAASRELESIRDWLTRYEPQLPVMERRYNMLDRLIRRIDSLIADYEQRIPVDDGVASELKSLNARKLKLEDAQDTARAEYGKIRVQCSAVDSEAKNLLRRASEIASKQITIMASICDADSAIIPLEDAIRVAKKNLSELRSSQQQMMETSRDSTFKLRSYDDTLKTLRKREKALNGELTHMNRRRYSTERDLTDCQTRISALAESLPPDHNLPLDMDPTPLIAALKNEMQSLPPLNANAPASYARVTSEYRSMSERKNSLELERNKIVSFMEGVGQEKRETYLRAFDKVDKEIREIFGSISGGRAWLELEDEDDLFTKGIRYMVQFPDKSARTTTSLSGGEKTLTAVVFVLALQKLKPSPFYLFDEVDAHLDAPNSERLAKILEECSKDSQFIMVSLKESVVQKAGLIYGAYPKDGLTQVVVYKDPRLRQTAY